MLVNALASSVLLEDGYSCRNCLPRFAISMPASRRAAISCAVGWSPPCRDFLINSWMAVNALASAGEVSGDSFWPQTGKATRTETIAHTNRGDLMRRTMVRERSLRKRLESGDS